eukprot:scaffold3183_cov120-Isochrysis_galbana.AAC.2
MAVATVAGWRRAGLRVSNAEVVAVLASWRAAAKHGPQRLHRTMRPALHPPCHSVRNRHPRTPPPHSLHTHPPLGLAERIGRGWRLASRARRSWPTSRLPLSSSPSDRRPSTRLHLGPPLPRTARAAGQGRRAPSLSTTGDSRPAPTPRCPGRRPAWRETPLRAAPW